MKIIDNTAEFKAEIPYTELMLGCGYIRKKRIKLPEDSDDFKNLITLDINPRVNPDVLHDLNVLPWPFQDEEFDEIHAYEVLEHIGSQGDVKTFFAHFNELYRILKPGGTLYASTPTWDGMWAWSDPGHTRIISEGSLIFLNQDNYVADGSIPLTDYRDIYHGNFQVEGTQEQHDSLYFMLRKK